MSIKEQDWYGLYREGWGQELIPDAFAHPAKFARGLIRRIYDHLAERGYIKPGTIVVDPFAGVGCGALDAMRLGCYWIGSELEQKFVDLGQQNLEQWMRWYRPLWPDTWGMAILLQGDSRELGQVIADAEAVISSPPYIRIVGQGETVDEEKIKERERRHLERHPELVGKRPEWTGYGATTGQLGAMPEGDVDAVISSPPYIGSVNQSDGANDAEARIERKAASGIDINQSVNVGGPNSVLNRPQAYGATPGQLGAMTEGDVQAVVSSPPYRGGGHHSGVFDTWGGEIGETDTPAWSRLAKKSEDNGYGQADGQMEQMGKENDFWHAARAIVDQCHAILAPGGVAVWVVKRFVRDKQIVPFPNQWAAMCEAAGFETIEWIRAWLVENHGTQMDLWGNGHEKTVDRKSFFRRLYESKYPQNSIDWEDVIIMRKLG